MTDHASILRQIDKEAEPYIEQWLDLAGVFTGFRKLATEHGLDWGQVKALLKARAQDKREGGTAKVDRIIEKADFASAYADMLGLGSKMNENNLISELHKRHDGAVVSIEAVMAGIPPHDPSTGELIEEQNSADCQDAVGAGQSAPPSGGAVREAAPTIPSPNISRSVAAPAIPPATATPVVEALPAPTGVPIPEYPDLPSFLDRRIAA